MNVDTLITQVLTRLDEVDPLVPVHWTRAEILVYVNEALSELNLIAWEFQNTEPVTINSSDNVYDHPEAIIAAIAARDGKYLRREIVDDLDKEVLWESPSEKRLNVRSWAPLGLNKFLIYPRPQAPKMIFIEGLVEHTPVTDAAMALPVRSEYESAVQDFCVERATFKEGGQELGQASSLYTDFLNSVQSSSGRNVIRMYPRFSLGQVNDEALRDQVEGNEK